MSREAYCSLFTDSLSQSHTLARKRGSTTTVPHSKDLSGSKINGIQDGKRRMHTAIWKIHSIRVLR